MLCEQIMKIGTRVCNNVSIPVGRRWRSRVVYDIVAFDGRISCYSETNNTGNLTWVPVESIAIIDSDSWAIDRSYNYTAVKELFVETDYSGTYGTQVVLLPTWLYSWLASVSLTIRPIALRLKFTTLEVSDMSTDIKIDGSWRFNLYCCHINSIPTVL